MTSNIAKQEKTTTDRDSERGLGKKIKTHSEKEKSKHELPESPCTAVSQGHPLHLIAVTPTPALGVRVGRKKLRKIPPSFCSFPRSLADTHSATFTWTKRQEVSEAKGCGCCPIPPACCPHAVPRCTDKAALRQGCRR